MGSNFSTELSPQPLLNFFWDRVLYRPTGLELTILLRMTLCSLSSCHRCNTLPVLSNAFIYMKMKELYNSSVTLPHFTLMPCDIYVSHTDMITLS